MTPAEFKTIRESLGLTAQWIADHAGVKLRTVQYWEAGRMAVPADVANMLNDIDKTLEATVEQAIAHIDELTKQQVALAEITLVRYRTDADLWRFRPDMKPFPATTHAAMLSRLRRALWSRNIQSIIEFMEPDEYLAWLDGRPDTELERAAWAATLQD
jgi:transcriptional regulator with XRE-family HTH domain